MPKRTRNIILAIVALQIVVIVGLLALPSVVQAIPGRYRVALQERNPFLSNIAEGVIEAVAPVATALPAPQQSNADQVDIAALIAADSPAPAATAPEAADEALSEVTTGAADTAVSPPEPTAEATVAVVETAAATPTVPPTATLAPTATPSPEPTATPEPLPERVVLENMTAVRQSFNNCGPANLTQVLNWYGSDITQEDVASYLKPNPEDRNVSPWQIADYVNELTPGFQAIARSGGTLDMVKRFIAAGYPVVIEKGYELPDSGWWGHYLTMFGYDDARQELYSQDSYLGPFDGSGRTDSYEEIEQFWQQFNYTFYVVYRPEQEAEVMAILGPEMEDDFTMWQQVASKASAEAEARPDDAFAQFNLGTALTRMGAITGEAKYYQGAAQAFDKAREIGLPPRMLWYQFEPYLAYMRVDRYQDMVDLADATLANQGGRNVEETYLYKGHALAFLGNVVGAREAYQEALRVNENFYPAEIALNSIGG